MRETKLTTLIYKYNPYARFIFFLYLLGLFLFGVFAIDYIPMYIVWLVICVWSIPLVYGAISKKTVFNFSAWDNDLLALSPSVIWVGKQKFTVAEVKLELQLQAYDGFVYLIRTGGTLGKQLSYGHGNTLLIYHKSGVRDIEFHLRDYESYMDLCMIVDEWKTKGISLTVKEVYTREFVKKQFIRKQRKRNSHLNR